LLLAARENKAENLETKGAENLNLIIFLKIWILTPKRGVSDYVVVVSAAKSSNSTSPATVALPTMTYALQ